MVSEKQFYFSPYNSFSFLFISIQNVNWFLDKFIPQYINVIAPNNDLLMDELKQIYFAPKWWLYVMIWLPRTTDISTYFAQSLEIRGIESRLYFQRYIQYQRLNAKKFWFPFQMAILMHTFFSELWSWKRIAEQNYFGLLFSSNFRFWRKTFWVGGKTLG